MTIFYDVCFKGHISYYAEWPILALHLYQHNIFIDAVMCSLMW